MDDANVTTALFSRLTTVAILAAQRAGEVVRRGYGRSKAVSSKGDQHDLVTEIDVASEQTIIECVKEFFPGHNFLAEERGAEGDVSDTVTWIIDPLDGTVNYVHDIPMFAISVAATAEGRTLSAVVYHPLLNELFVAERGKGAFLNGTRLAVSKTDVLADAFIATGFPYNVHDNPHHCIELFSSFARTGTPIRRLGAATLDLCYVAAGRFDAFWEVSLKPWDVAAAQLIIEEAGGKVTRFTEETFDVEQEGPIIATNGLLHQQFTNSIHTFEETTT